MITDKPLEQFQVPGYTLKSLLQCTLLVSSILLRKQMKMSPMVLTSCSVLLSKWRHNKRMYKLIFSDIICKDIILYKLSVHEISTSSIPMHLDEFVCGVVHMASHLN